MIYPRFTIIQTLASITWEEPLYENSDCFMKRKWVSRKMVVEMAFKVFDEVFAFNVIGRELSDFYDK